MLAFGVFGRNGFSGSLDARFQVPDTYPGVEDDSWVLVRSPAFDHLDSVDVFRARAIRPDSGICGGADVDRMVCLQGDGLQQHAMG